MAVYAQIKTLEHITSEDFTLKVKLETTLTDDAGKVCLIVTGFILGSEEYKLSAVVRDLTEGEARQITREEHDATWEILMDWAQPEDSGADEA